MTIPAPETALMIKIIGAEMSDTVFTLDAPGFPELIWNVTRLQKDAEAGRFGPPRELRTIDIPAFTEKGWNTLDIYKVQRMVRSRGQENATINKPLICVLYPQNGVLNAFIVDGNHRFAARVVAGLPTFQRFEVPPNLEGEYRVKVQSSRPRSP